MITDKEIEERAAGFQIRTIEVQKDYVYGWLLKAIFSRPILARQLVLKGGNALRKGYLSETRFSKDLDFSARDALTQAVLERELREVCAYVEAETGVRFLDKVTIKDKEFGIPDIEALEARLYFKTFFGEENLSLKTQLDVTQFDRIYLPVQARPLIHPYSDAAGCVATISCHKLEEVLASKLSALLHRRRAQDLFDLLYAVVFRDTFGVNRREVITTFLKKSLFENEPMVAKQQLGGILIPEFSSLWSSLIVPAVSTFAFDYVLANFNTLIDSLFALLVPEARPMPAAAGRLVRSGFGGRIPFGGSAGFRGYFPSDARQTIISAGRARTMVELVYDGYTRLVEPYKIEYYVRKKDGQGLEYFWGWDTTGGRSGKSGIKQFICDKIQRVSLTNHSYAPRYQIEV